MKKFLIISGYVFGGILLCLYLAFLLVIPNKIDLNAYKSQVQTLVKDNTGLDIDFGKIKVITTPFLEAGVKIYDIRVTLPDKSEALYIDRVKGKVFLPSLLWLNVKVSFAEIRKPRLNIDIENGEQFKLSKAFEDIVNKKRQDKLAHPEKYAQEEEPVNIPFDITKIKVNIPALKINQYNAKINDIKDNHSLTLKGDNVTLTYRNGVSARIKADAKIYNDKKENIIANIDIDSVLPKFILPEKEEEDLEAVYKIPFVNPVKIYRDYDLKSNISSKLKIRKARRKDNLKMNGFFNIEDTTITLSGLELPKSYFRLKANGYNTDIDTNLYVTNEEYINLFGKVFHGKKPKFDLTLKSTKVHLSSLLDVVRAYLTTIHLNTDIDSMSADGYFLADAHVKTDFNNLESSGRIIVKEGNIVDKGIGFLFDDINLNLYFNDNIFKVSDSHILINGKPLNISGMISSKAIADLSIQGTDIPLYTLYNGFAPKEIKRAYDLASANLSVNANISGAIKNLTGLLRTELTDLIIKDKKKTFTLSDKKARFGLALYDGNIKARLENSGFAMNIPAANSTLSDDSLIIDIDESNIDVLPSVLKFNKNSDIEFRARLNNYMSNFDAELDVDGKLAASDIGIALGEVARPYLDLKGNLPIKAKGNADKKKINFIGQLMADSANYITPVVMDDFVGKQTIAQIKINKNNDTVKIENTGLFVKNTDEEFSDNFAQNVKHAKELVGLKGIITNVPFQPFISLLKINTAHDLAGHIHVFKKSKFISNIDAHAYGKPNNLNIRGNILLKDLSIPEILTKIEKIGINLGSKDIVFNIENINANGSDFALNGKTTWNFLTEMKFFNVIVESKFIDINKLLKISDAVIKNIPTSEPQKGKKGVEESNDIPLQVLSGGINFRRIVMDKIIVRNTSAKIAILKNILYVTKLNTHPLGGVVLGSASMNLVSQEMAADVSGKQFDVAKVLLDVMDMKDMLSGQMNFVVSVKLKGTELEEQMKSLNGTVDFNIKNGQLGPFGKFENFLMAENIRENAFFSSSIGSIINNLLSFDTSRFNSLYGHISFKDGVAEISPIKSQGNVMSMFIFGNLNLLDNTAEMKVRGKLASGFSDKLGPLANINPINLVKHTPGLNIVLAKTFSVFCESLSQEEMDAIPELGEGKSDVNATKFQIRLKGDTRKPLTLIKSFKWLALDSEIESAKEFVDTIPAPEPGEEGLSVEELVKLREEQAAAAEAEAKRPINRIKKLFGYQ